MKAKRHLGIWMDHASAHIMDGSGEATEMHTGVSKFSHEVHEQSLSKGEHLAHNKEQHQQLEYYNQLGEIIKNYDRVLLFGPTDAKKELHNVLKNDHHFDNVTIDIASADKMTENQERAFVKAHFEAVK